MSICVLVVGMALTQVRALPQSPDPNDTASVQGYVRDSNGKQIGNAGVRLETNTQNQFVVKQMTHTDSEGHYQFVGLSAGSYSVRADFAGYDEATVEPVKITAHETAKIDLTLSFSKATAVTSQTEISQAPEFFDEPQFTVAGVTQTNSGGHGSDTVLRTTEALAKATVSLSAESRNTSNATASALTESSLREAISRDPKDAAPHHRLAEMDEKLGNPLDAVREYQTAAELDPSEPNLFDWGTELLAHRALEPATEVFQRGNRMFPKSVRMLIALGVAWYSRGSYELASEYLVKASDLAPDDATPYLFLGKMQSVEGSLTEKSAERLARFAHLQPENALANYYYAVSLSRQTESTERESESEKEHDLQRVESLLQKAIQLDPELGAAELQLGISNSRQKDFSRAISAYQKAIQICADTQNDENDETLSEAHYRLAQVYLRIGEKVKAEEELKLHDQATKKTKEDLERGLRETQGFLVSIREKVPK